MKTESYCTNPITNYKWTYFTRHVIEKRGDRHIFGNSCISREISVKPSNTATRCTQYRWNLNSGGCFETVIAIVFNIKFAFPFGGGLKFQVNLYSEKYGRTETLEKALHLKSEAK